MREPLWACLHERIVAKDYRSEATIVDVRPVWVSGFVFTEGQHRALGDLFGPTSAVRTGFASTSEKANSHDLTKGALPFPTGCEPLIVRQVFEFLQVAGNSSMHGREITVLAGDVALAHEFPGLIGDGNQRILFYVGHLIRRTCFEASGLSPEPSKMLLFVVSTDDIDLVGLNQSKDEFEYALAVGSLVE